LRAPRNVLNSAGVADSIAPIGAQARRRAMTYEVLAVSGGSDRLVQAD
jgi:hypothetical protein